MSNKPNAAGLFGQDGSDLFQQFSGPSSFILAAPAPVPAPPVAAPAPQPQQPPQQKVTSFPPHLSTPGQQNYSSLPNMNSRGGGSAVKPPPLSAGASYQNISQQRPPLFNPQSQPTPPLYNPQVHGGGPNSLQQPPLQPPTHQPHQVSPSGVSLPPQQQSQVSPQRPTQVVQPIQQQQQQQQQQQVSPPPPFHQPPLSTSAHPPPPPPAFSTPASPATAGVAGPLTSTAGVAGRLNAVPGAPLPVPICAPHWYGYLFY